MKMPRLPSSPVCPTCDSRLDGATQIEGKAVAPCSGDVSICIYCMEYLEFDDDIKLVTLDVNTLDPEMAANLDEMCRGIRERRRPKLH